nr:uncharacterized protein LOC117227326 [Megalopta genalis]
MIERLMKTTTGNPSKEGPGDQGIEYSDYYSEDDVLQDIVANKIPVNAAETTNPDRFIRQTLNATSYRCNNQIQPCYQAARNRDFSQADYPINSFNGFQQYPTVERRATLSRNTRHRGTDDSSLYYDPSYMPLDDRIENSPYAFSTMVPEWVPGTSGLNDNFMVPELRNNFDAADPNLSSEEMQRAVAVPPNADQLDFLGRNSKPLDVVDPLTVLQSPNTVAEVPQSSHKLTAFELQNLNNYHRGTSLQRLNNIDQNVYSQPQLGAIPTVDEGIGHFESKDYNFLPVQDYNNNPPAVNVPNAMNQPLGKVLQSLGINVHVDSPASNKENSISPTYRNNGMDDANDASLSHFETHDRPVDHDPTNCDKDDTRQTNDRNGNTNLRGSQRRRHLAKKGSQSSNLFSLLEGEGNSNSSDTVHDTKEIASQVLDTIMEELQELKLDGSKNDKKEGLPCRLSGSWSTAQAGVKLNMKVVNHNIIVTFSDIASPRYHESLLNGTWNVSGHAPLKRGSPFTLTATDNTTNSMAVFIGACKVCQGIDTIAGVWSIARSPKDCRDFQVATSVFNDIFRKSKLSSLKETKNSKNATAEQKKKRS